VIGKIVGTSPDGAWNDRSIASTFYPTLVASEICSVTE
jgi:hypothetical protein